MSLRRYIFIGFLLLLLSCNLFQLAPGTTPAAVESPAQTSTSTILPLPIATATPLPTITQPVQPSPSPVVTAASPALSPSPTLPPEAILILEPGPGSRVTSPVRVVGEADPTFEQSLVIRIVLDDGSELVIAPAQIASDIDRRGPFEADVPFLVGEQRQAFIQVFSTSPRDGGVTHLASVGVTLLPAGEAQINPVDPYPERILIYEPKQGDILRGGNVRVSGFALASFEQTLVVEVLDAEGNRLALEPVMVRAPDLGFPGPFEIEMAYLAAPAGPGRVVVRDISPAHGGDAHLSSVEVTIEP